tara:strand:+ start:6108 stop:7022 length:915 start_codon:yes stop_codon:yes gene_type:complete
MSWLSEFLGTNPIRHDFNYDVSTADYNTNTGLLSSINNINQTGGRLSNMGNQLFTRGQGLLSGQDPMLLQQRNWLSRGLQDVGAQQGLALNRNLAMRGIGSGGIRSIIGASRDRGLGEEYQKGLLSIGRMGLDFGTRLSGLGTQAVGQAGGLYGTAGQLGAGIDSRTLQANMFNAGQTNQRNQFASNMAYQQAVGNRAQKASFANSLIGLVGGLAGNYLGGQMMGNILGRTGAGAGTGNVPGTTASAGFNMPGLPSLFSGSGGFTGAYNRANQGVPGIAYNNPPPINMPFFMQQYPYPGQGGTD